MTHTTKHTPGPWVVRNKDAVYAQSGRFIADCELTPYGSRPQPPNSTDEANAHLIAAAPAMYAESKTLCSLVCAFMNDNRLYDGQLIQAIHNLETALAQAKGRHS